MNWRTDPPNWWTALYRLAVLVLLVGMYAWVGHVNGETTMVGQLIGWLLGSS